MRRVVLAVVVVALAAGTACSSDSNANSTSAADGGLSEIEADADDPIERLCSRWADYKALTESDQPPDDTLVAEVLDLHGEIEQVLPSDLDAAWAGVAGWDQAFIELFARTGYREPTAEDMPLAFGGDEEAETSANAREAGEATIDAWSATNCETGEGDASAFCVAWTDIAPLLAQLDEESPTERLVDELFVAYDETGPDVPAEIRDDWDALLSFAVPFRDVLVTVEYNLDRVADELLVQAFGSLEEVERLESAAEAGEEAINGWSIEGCGDFCARWGETGEALDQLGNWLGWIPDFGDEGTTRFDAMRARIDLAAELRPDELADEWVELETMLNDWIEWWAGFEFDETRIESPQGRDRTREFAERAPYFENFAFEQWGGPEADREAFLVELWSDPQRVHDVWTGGVVDWISRARDDVQQWVDANCDVAGGRPGRIRVNYPEIEGAVGSTLVIAVMATGATVVDIGDLDAQQAGWCDSVSRDPWGYELDPDGNRNPWGTDWFRSERGQWEADWLCGFSWEEGPATLEAGPHTLLAALVPGGVQGPTLPALPTACLAVDFDIDGDTELQLPPLLPCETDLSELVFDPDPWRTVDPVDPSTPGAGTLKVTVPSLVPPDDMEGEHGGELTIVVLPAGTTLNDVGREEVWPSGGNRTHLVPRQDQAQVHELERLGAVAVPIMAMPPTGAFGHIDPGWLHEASPDQLPLTVLAPGDYDVHVQVWAYSEAFEETRCGRTTVTIDGDTVIDMPELGECP